MRQVRQQSERGASIIEYLLLLALIALAIIAAVVFIVDTATNSDDGAKPEKTSQKAHVSAHIQAPKSATKPPHVTCEDVPRYESRALETYQKARSDDWAQGYATLLLTQATLESQLAQLGIQDCIAQGILPPADRP